MARAPVTTDTAATTAPEIAPSAAPQGALSAAAEDPCVLETADGLKYFPPAREAAWLGLLQVHADLTRGLDAELSGRHGLSLSSYELLARLAFAPEGHLRMSALADQSQLSLSRVSRLIDHLESRGLAARRSCPGDSRVVHTTITPAGRKLVGDAQETFFTTLEERFLGRLTCDEIDALGGLMQRLLAGRS